MNNTQIKILLLAGMCINLSLLSAGQPKIKLSPQEVVLTAIETAGPFENVPMTKAAINTSINEFYKNNLGTPGQTFSSWRIAFSRQLRTQCKLNQNQSDWVIGNATREGLKTSEFNEVINCAVALFPPKDDDHKE